MLQRLLRQLQHVVTALVLLIILLIGAELWFRNARPVRDPAVATQADVSDQSWLVPSATQHHLMRPLSDVVSDDGLIQFRTNSLGLRGPEPSLAATDGTFRILLLGDDTVAGAWLEEADTLSVRLQKYLAANLDGPVEVVNAGVPGYSPVLSLLQYEQDLARLRADVVVLHFDMSDVADESVHRGSLRMEGSRSVCIHPFLAQDNGKKNRLLSMFRESALAKAVSEQFFKFPDRGADRDRYAWTRSGAGDLRIQIRHTMDSVTRLRARTQKANQMLLVTTAPVSWQVLAPARNRSLSGRFGINGEQPVTDDLPFQLLSAWSRHTGVPLCTSIDVFRAVESPEKLFQTNSPRLSKDGTDLYAREMARTILATPQAVAGRLRTVR
ncbi:MAG: SGNH/GDSL hydrolase family protein [Planctomycetaceae bacterium]